MITREQVDKYKKDIIEKQELEKTKYIAEKEFELENEIKYLKKQINEQKVRISNCKKDPMCSKDIEYTTGVFRIRRHTVNNLERMEYFLTKYEKELYSKERELEILRADIE